MYQELRGSAAPTTVARVHATQHRHSLDRFRRSHAAVPYKRQVATAAAGRAEVQQSSSAPQPAQQLAPHPTTYREDADVLDEADIKIIGLGQRGISATSRLMGNKSMQGGEFWVLDTDAKVLSSCGAPNTIRITEDDAQLSPAELARLAGDAAVAAAAAAPSQRPGSPVQTCGVAFLVAGAGGIPGGSTLLLQVAAYLRRVGFFVVTALTRPFEFEGRRKLEEADALIEALQDVAQLVVVVPQGVLTRASAELTINEASAIADNTLEVSCRAILWALGAPEVLRASAGTMLWHGRDLRQYKRLLSPPLEVLLTCPGVGGLGRGLASIPVASLAEAGLASGLSTLAEDAVAAAVESPFLENVMPSASGVLCVLSLPARVLSHDFNMAPGALNDPEKYAIRAAVQVAAMTVVELAGRHCEEVVVCAHVRPDWPHADPGLLCLEATLLVLEDPAAAEEAASSGSSSSSSSSQSYPYMTPPPAAARPGSTSPSGPILHSAQFKQPMQQQQQQWGGAVGAQRSSQVGQPGGQQQGPQQQAGTTTPAAPAASAASNRSAWSAMSAIAGGSAAAAVGQYKKQGGPTPRSQSTQGIINGSSSSSSNNRSNSPGRPAAGAGSTGNGSSSNSSNKPSFVNFFGGGVLTSNAAGNSSSREPSPARSGAAGSSPAFPGGSGSFMGRQPSAAQQQQQAGSTGDAGELTLVPRMADKHVDSMMAQSLDLPPSAARWRHQQRRQQQQKQQQPKRSASHFPLAVVPWNSGAAAAPGGPGAAGLGVQAAGAVVEGFVGGSHDLDEEERDAPRDVRSRVAGMLQQERKEGWLYDQQDDG